jgi:hypothetical protein
VDNIVKKIVFSWLGFCFVIVVSFVSCGVLIHFLSKADYSFNRLIVSRHNSLQLFANVNCSFPPVLSKEDFLSEVRYLGNLKEEYDLLEEGILARIFNAFQAHPWVQKVVDVQREGPQKIKVILEFRTPALVVPITPIKDQIEAADKFRVVDVNGVILPKNALQVGLPVLALPLPFPTDKAGVQWKKEQVISCAKIIGCFSGVVFPNGCLIEVKDDVVLIYSEIGPFKIVWGPLSTNEQIANQEVDERKTVFKTKYSAWKQTDMKNGFIIIFSSSTQK